MDSLGIYEIKNTILNYIKEQPIPCIVKKWILADVSADIENELHTELLNQSKLREQEENKID